MNAATPTGALQQLTPPRPPPLPPPTDALDGVLLGVVLLGLGTLWWWAWPQRAKVRRRWRLWQARRHWPLTPAHRLPPQPQSGCTPLLIAMPAIPIWEATQQLVDWARQHALVLPEDWWTQAQVLRFAAPHPPTEAAEQLHALAHTAWQAAQQDGAP
jgi:hypothetical protein